MPLIFFCCLILFKRKKRKYSPPLCPQCSKPAEIISYSGPELFGWCNCGCKYPLKEMKSYYEKCSNCPICSDKNYIYI